MGSSLASRSKTKASRKGKAAARPTSKGSRTAGDGERKKKPSASRSAARGATEKAAPVAVAGASASLSERRSRLPPKLTVRVPAGADELKAKIGALATAAAQIRNLRRTLARSFMDIGDILAEIRDRRLYEAKGFGSFEAFLEREIDLGRVTSLRLVRAVELFQRPAALAGGMDRVLAAVAAFDGDVDLANPQTSAGALRSPIPFHKR